MLRLIPGHIIKILDIVIRGRLSSIDHGLLRMDDMEKCGHYSNWRKDFGLVDEPGLHFLPYRPPIHKTWLGVNKYDWTFADVTLSEFPSAEHYPIVDLCYFGLPDWLGTFRNPFLCLLSRFFFHSISGTNR